MKKFWILPVTALMISCGAATEEAPAEEEHDGHDH